MAHLDVDDRGLLVACASCGQKNRLAFERLGSPVRCGACKASIAVPSTPLEVGSTADFDRIIAHASVPVLVDYWAPWCGPCRAVAPELAKVAAHGAGRLIVLKVNTDELGDLGQRFRIRSIPTMAVFRGGREVSRASGAMPAAGIEELIARAV